jgi:hypothetical protein
MRFLLIAALACACVTEGELDESAAELWDDDAHCPGGGYGGGSGNPGGGPGDKPARKNCADLGTYPDVESCKQCCFYNNDHVDGWECRRKKSRAAQEKCWREANEKMGKCNQQCEWDRGGITTINPTFP